MPFLGKSPTAGFASIVKDDLTPNGSTTAFTLSKQVANANDIAVFLGNVRQEPTDAYTVSGTTLTMSEAPASGLNFYVLHIAGTLESSVVPADDTISTAKIQSSAITDAKIAGMAASKLTGALPALNGSALTGVNAITEIDSWEMATSFSPGGNAYITSNWSRTNDSAFEYSGTGLTQSSGVFSFPSTGKYFISYIGYFSHNGNDGFVGIQLYVTTDNSTYGAHGTSAAAGNRVVSDPTMSSSSFALLDVTNTSNVKFKFQAQSLNPCSLGRAQFYCFRVGDT